MKVVGEREPVTGVTIRPVWEKLTSGMPNVSLMVPNSEVKGKDFFSFVIVLTHFKRRYRQWNI